MSEHDHTLAKLDAFLEVLDDLMGETLAAGVSATGLRWMLLARAVYEFRADPAAGLETLDHFRKALVRQLAPAVAGGSIQ